MDTVIRGIVVYLFLLVVFRIAGKRTLANITTFDFVLVLILSETVQQGLIDNDNSLTNACLLVLTLIGLDVGLSFSKRRWPRVERLLEGSPAMIIENGRLNREAMRRERVDEADILHAAREHQAISRLDQIDYAIVEESGGITVIPKKDELTNL